MKASRPNEPSAASPSPSAPDDYYSGLLQPEALFKATEDLATQQHSKSKWVVAFNTAILAKDQLRVGQLLDSPEQHLGCGEHIQRLLRVAMELADWKTLTRLLFVQTLKPSSGNKKLKPQDRFACTFVTERELVDASKRLVQFNSKASNVQIAAQKMCFSLLSAAKVRNLELDTKTDFTLQDLCEFCEKDDLISLANAWLAFHTHANMTPAQFCELESPKEQAPSVYFSTKEEDIAKLRFTLADREDRAKLITKSYETPRKRMQSPSAVWTDQQVLQEGFGGDYDAFYSECIVPHALNFHSANLLELTQLHQATGCSIFLQALASGRLQ